MYIVCTCTYIIHVHVQLQDDRWMVSEKNGWIIVVSITEIMRLGCIHNAHVILLRSA